MLANRNLVDFLFATSQCRSSEHDGEKQAFWGVHGAKIELCPTRSIVDQKVEDAANEAGTVWIPPYNHPQVIAGQGTVTVEIYDQMESIDAIAAPCGGGGLLSGTLIAARALSENTQVIGVEPTLANDAARSRRSGNIEYLSETPNTIADGVRTPSVGNFTFPFIQQLDDFFEVEEDDIIYWTQWLQHLLKLHIEPTSAMPMAGVVRWLSRQPNKCRVVVILSGGNIDQPTMQLLWEKNHLSEIPGTREH